MVDATRHDTFARQDYHRLADQGIFTARDGLRWHKIETRPNKYDFSSVEKQLVAAAETEVEVIWDLFHYGYPDGIDIFSKDFAFRLADLAAAFVEYHLISTGSPPMIIPVNEISFFSWIAGDIGHFYPFGVGRGDELKRSLVYAFIEAALAVRSVSDSAIIFSSEPLVNVVPSLDRPDSRDAAEAYRLSQYQAIDMLTGRLMPELGGRSDIIDAIGLNYYPHNQWYYPDREMISLSDKRYRPLREMLLEAGERYAMPILISETGTEDGNRVPWFKYVVDESREARDAGAKLIGICLYPIVNHPGWEDERHCHNGLWDYCDEEGHRPIFEQLAFELQQASSVSPSAH